MIIPAEIPIFTAHAAIYSYPSSFLAQNRVGRGGIVYNIIGGLQL